MSTTVAPTWNELSGRGSGSPPAVATAAERIDSIDLLRGLVIVLMAVDHVRDFWALTPFPPEDLVRGDAGWFLTRWITHFCAPIFVLLAGTAAWLYGDRQGDRRVLSKFLLTRGLWLILVELLIINPSWQFGLGYLFVQVIWAIGWSMIALAGLIWLPRAVLIAVALLMIFGHNLLDGVQPADLGSLGWLWAMLHQQQWIPLHESGFGAFVVYPLIPWIGVMAAGYALGPLFRLPRGRRRFWLYVIGAGITVLFVGLRWINGYGDPDPWAVQERGTLYTILSFLDTTKYPPSLLFLAMTLGPGLMALALFERLRGPLARALLVYGQVPFFFYIIHVPAIHAAARIYNQLVYGQNFGVSSSAPWPDSYEPRVWMVYLVWAAALLALYWPCRWFRDLKQRERRPWMSYL